MHYLRIYASVCEAVCVFFGENPPRAKCLGVGNPIGQCTFLSCICCLACPSLVGCRKITANIFLGEDKHRVFALRAKLYFRHSCGNNSCLFLLGKNTFKKVVVAGVGTMTYVSEDGLRFGAVTHVFVNDPTRGYGIFIENMLSEDEKIK